MIETELQLRSDSSGSDEELVTRRQQLQDLEVQLDQCWDLLRQRRAQREFGQDPDDSQVRPSGEVENYLQ